MNQTGLSTSSMSLRRNLPKLLMLGLSVFATAALGAMASVGAAEFYVRLTQPSWAPPARMFGPAWTLLYVMIGIAAWRVSLHSVSTERCRALILFFTQLVLNALWSWLFFAWKLGAWAMLDLVALFVTVLFTALNFWRINRPTGVLLLPYLAWLVFAGMPNWAIWSLNPALLG